MSTRKLAYRPEIDGLRAVAVGAVILYHAQFEIGGVDPFRGGYLGVDVFLVISGYLIAALILKEYSARQRFSFKRFYARRVRRLLPALLLVLAATVPFAWIYMVPSQLVDYARSMASALLLSSNVYFHVSLQEYGAESGLLKPLLHCWSLSLEEQFYLLFPAGLVALLRFPRRHLIPVIGAAALASLLFAQWASGAHPSSAFYLLPARSWEFLAGALLAGLELRGNGRPRAGRKSLGAALGLLLILGSILGFDGATRHPSLLTVIPVLGTMLVIWWAGSDDPCGRLLSGRAFVATGLISYSLYLWHYPVFAFGRLAHVEPSATEKVLWILLAVGLAALSYRWVEQPFRDARRTSRNVLWANLAGAGLLLAGFCSLAVHQDGFRSRFNDLAKVYGQNELDNKVLQLQSWEPLNRLAEGQGLPRGRFERTRLWFSPGIDQKRRVLLVGNSHSKDLFNALDQNRELFPNLEVARYSLELRATVEPKVLNTLLRSPNFEACDVVAICTRYYDDGSPDDLDALPALVDTIRGHGKSLVVISNGPEFRSYQSVPIFDYHARVLKESLAAPALEKIFYRRLDPRVSRINRRLQEIAEALDIPYLDRMDLTCQLQQGRCMAMTPDGYKLYYDYGHYTLEGARYVGQLIHERDWLQLP